MASAPFPSSFTLPANALMADAAVVYDPSTGRLLYQKNADISLPIASITKLLSADMVLSESKPTQQVVISEADAAQINDPGDYGIVAGQLWKIGELVRYALFASSNNAMLAAATAATQGSDTVSDMNRFAQSLGLTESRFYDPTGLDVSATVSGGYASARDVAMLAADFYRKYPAYFETSMNPKGSFGPLGDTFSAEPTAAPIQNIPGVLAAKTGYTDLAQGTMVAVFDVSLGHSLVAVVLHSTEQGRFQDIRTLIAAARGAQ
ncbi:MAG: D-alanyl-D-alanine carboxypeptidase family protein [Minisyncoccia bacterium]